MCRVHRYIYSSKDEKTWCHYFDSVVKSCGESKAKNHTFKIVNSAISYDTCCECKLEKKDPNWKTLPKATRVKLVTEERNKRNAAREKEEREQRHAAREKRTATQRENASSSQGRSSSSKSSTAKDTSADRFVSRDRIRHEANRKAKPSPNAAPAANWQPLRMKDPKVRVRHTDDNANRQDRLIRVASQDSRRDPNVGASSRSNNSNRSETGKERRNEREGAADHNRYRPESRDSMTAADNFEYARQPSKVTARTMSRDSTKAPSIAGRASRRDDPRKAERVARQTPPEYGLYRAESPSPMSRPASPVSQEIPVRNRKLSQQRTTIMEAGSSLEANAIFKGKHRMYSADSAYGTMSDVDRYESSQAEGEGSESEHLEDQEVDDFEGGHHDSDEYYYYDEGDNGGDGDQYGD